MLSLTLPTHLNQRRASESRSNEAMQLQSSPTSTDSEESPAVSTTACKTAVSGGNTHQSRQRLRPWLENLVNVGSVKGLEWIDKEKKLFKIPWKHAGKQDYNQEEDSKIFKLWSLNTGKFKPGVHVPEPAVWKTRLRTALNKLPDIDEVHEKTQLDIPEPYRVYRLLPKKPSNAAIKNRMPTSPPYDHDNLRHMTMNSYQTERYNPYGNVAAQRSQYHGTYGHAVHSGYQQYNMYDQERTEVEPSYGYQGYNNCYTPSSTAVDLDIINDVITQDIGTNNSHHHPSGHNHYPQNNGHVYDQEGGLAMDQGRITKIDMADTLVNNNDPRHVNYHNMVSMPTVTSSGYTTCATTTKTHNLPPSYESALNEHAHHPFTTTTCCATSVPTDSAAMDTTSVSNQLQYTSASPRRMRACSETTLPDEHTLAIQISYRSTDAGYRCIDNPAGCVLYSNHPWEEGINRGMEAVALPNVGEVSPYPDMTGNQMKLTSDVLRCFEKGMSIECRRGSIYVTRRCRSVVFWCAANADDTPVKMERDLEVKVFDLEHFRDHLRRYIRGEDAPPVLPKIYFTVAQKWSSPDMPLHACLISIVVTPMRASEELRTISPEVHSLPVSIHSGLLQISGPPLPDCSSPLGLGNSWTDVMGQSCRMTPMPAIV